MAIRKGKYTQKSDKVSTTTTPNTETKTTNTSTDTPNTETKATTTKSTTSISGLVPDTKQAKDQLTKNEEEGKKTEGPSLEDIQRKAE